MPQIRAHRGQTITNKFDCQGVSTMYFLSRHTVSPLLLSEVETPNCLSYELGPLALVVPCSEFSINGLYKTIIVLGTALLLHHRWVLSLAHSNPRGLTSHPPYP